MEERKNGLDFLKAVTTETAARLRLGSVGAASDAKSPESEVRILVSYALTDVSTGVSKKTLSSFFSPSLATLVNFTVKFAANLT